MFQAKNLYFLKSKLSFFPPIFLLVLEVVIGFIQAPWDIDAHHDGIVYGAAVAASEGRKPNSEYFQQYGPLSSSLQGAFLKLTSPTLYSLRIFTVLTVSLIAFAIYFAARKTLGELGALSVAIVWSISSPRMHAVMLPWPSLYSSIFLIAALYFAQKYKNLLFHGISVGYFIASAFIALASLCRINVLGTISLLVFLLVIRQEWKILKDSVYGFISVTTIFNFVAAVLGFIDEFYYQDIIWAFGTYSTSGAEDAKGHLVNFLMYLTIPFFGIMTILLSRIIMHKLFAIIVFLLLLSTLFSQELKSNHQSYANPVYLYAFISKHSNFMFSYFGVFFCLAVLFHLLIRRKGSSSQIFVASIGASTIFQLYPTPDPLHLWWVAPVGIIAAFNLLDEQSKFGIWHIYTSGISRLSLCITVVLAIVLVQEIRIDRFSFQSSTLKNMQGTNGTDHFLDQTLLKLEHEPIKGRVSFDCQDGIYAVAGAQYLPMNKDYVNWSPRPEETIESAEYIFVCNSRTPALQYLPSSEWKTIFEVQFNDKSNFLLKRAKSG